MSTVIGELTKAGTFAGEVLDAAGYYVAGDGGGGRFTWDPSSQLAHDGGTIFEPVSSPVGRWLRSYQVGFVDVRWFGAFASTGWPGSTPYTGPTRGNKEAFEAATRCMSPTCVPTYHGPRVVVPPGRYDFADTLIIDRAAELVGVGWDGLASSWLKFPQDRDGIHVFRNLPPAYPAPVPPLYQQPRGDFSRLKGLRITGARGSGGHGVLVSATCALEDVYIDTFEGNGVHLDCSVPATNANGWSFTRVRVNSCHHGFYFDGSDTNAGAGIELSATSCRGWGILDESFLGNYFFGCHTASCAGSWSSTNANARSVFVGCYSEGDQAPPDVAMPSMIIGGISGGNSGSGGYLGEGFGALRLRRNQAFFDVDADPINPVRATLGSSGIGGTALELKAGAGQPYRLRYDGGTPGGWASRVGWWAMEYAALTAGAAFRFCDDKAAEWTRGLVGPKVAFDAGFFMGRAVRVLTTTGTAAPTTGNWKRGDRVINQTPSAGGWAGWVCVADGSPGTWKPFGAISA